MNVTVDTNILVRSLIRDDLQQADAADRILRQASLVAVTLPCLCEFVWAVRRVYGLTAPEAARAIQSLLDAKNVALDRKAVEEGLEVLRAGGDFADAVIAYEGMWAGGETFLSFDKKAVKLLTAKGYKAQLLI